MDEKMLGVYLPLKVHEKIDSHIAKINKNPEKYGLISRYTKKEFVYLAIIEKLESEV